MTFYRTRAPIFFQDMRDLSNSFNANIKFSKYIVTKARAGSIKAQVKQYLIIMKCKKKKLKTSKKILFVV